MGDNACCKPEAGSVFSAMPERAGRRMFAARRRRLYSGRRL